MMNKTNSKIYITLLSLSLTACATPKAIRTQSTATAAHIGHVTSELNRFAKEEKRLADERGERVINLHAIINEVEERRSKRLIGEPEKIFKSILKDMNEAEQRWAKSREREAKIRIKVKESTKIFSVPTKSLGKAQQDLAKLGEKTKRKEQLKFLLGFLKKTAEEVKKQKEKSEDKAKDATEEADTQAEKMEQSLTEEK